MHKEPEVSVSVTHPTIVLAAPSRALLASDGSGVDVARINAARANLQAMGWCVRCADNLTAVDRGLAGSDAERALALTQAFADPTTDVVMALRGGCGASRLLELLDWEKIAASEAVLVGLSDVTALHLAFLARLGKPGWQGPVGHWFADLNSPSWTVFAETISQKELCLRVPAQGSSFAAEGMLWGGNLTVLTSLLGTPWFPCIEGGILFLEDVNEPAWRIDRMLTQLELAGVLARQTAVLTGLFTGSDRYAAPGALGYRLADALSDLRSRSRLPVASGLHFGHVEDTLMLPVGVQARVSLEEGMLTLECPQVPVPAEVPGAQTPNGPLWWF